MEAVKSCDITIACQNLKEKHRDATARTSQPLLWQITTSTTSSPPPKQWSRYKSWDQAERTHGTTSM